MIDVAYRPIIKLSLVAAGLTDRILVQSGYRDFILR